MEKNTLTIGALAVIVGIGIGYLIWGTVGAPSGAHMMPGGSMMSQNIDQHFIVQMIPHHEGAIEMAKIAYYRSKRPEIQSLAFGIMEAQQKEIDDMRTWYEAWFGSVPSKGGMGMHMSGMTGEVDKLGQSSDVDFDREFLEQMIPHHEMAIMMAGMLTATTDRAEMKQLADNVVTSQSREIEMMRSWLKSWYSQ